MRTLYFELLLECQNSSILNKVNLSPFFLRNFPKPTIPEMLVIEEPLSADDREWKELKTRARQWSDSNDDLIKFIREVLALEQIEGLPDPSYILGSQPDDNGILQFKWIDESEIYGYLTIKGQEYLQQYRLIESNIELNQTSLLNLESQKLMSKTTIIVAFLSVLISLITLVGAYIKTDTTAQSIDKLREEIVELQKFNKGH